MTSHDETIRFPTDDGTNLSARLRRPARPAAAFVLAHGAGAGMEHPFMARLADELCAHAVATLRFQFPYMEDGRRRPDPPEVAQRAVRAAVATASSHLAGVPLFAGGKSFGGRMTSQAQAALPLPGVRGLVFVGFPLHPANRPSTQRAAHLADVRLPMLFLQGTRDTLADLGLVREVAAGLGPRATLRTFEDADHAFHVRAKSGSNDAQVLQELAACAAAWMAAVARASGAAI